MSGRLVSAEFKIFIIFGLLMWRAKADQNCYTRGEPFTICAKSFSNPAPREVGTGKNPEPPGQAIIYAGETDSTRLDSSR